MINDADFLLVVIVEVEEERVSIDYVLLLSPVGDGGAGHDFLDCALFRQINKQEVGNPPHKGSTGNYDGGGVSLLCQISSECSSISQLYNFTQLRSIPRKVRAIPGSCMSTISGSYSPWPPWLFLDRRMKCGSSMKFVRQICWSWYMAQSYQNIYKSQMHKKPQNIIFTFPHLFTKLIRFS